MASGREEYRTAAGFDVNSCSSPDAARSMFSGRTMARETMIPLATTSHSRHEHALEREIARGTRYLSRTQPSAGLLPRVNKSTWVSCNSAVFCKYSVNSRVVASLVVGKQEVISTAPPERHITAEDTVVKRRISRAEESSQARAESAIREC